MSGAWSLISFYSKTQSPEYSIGLKAGQTDYMKILFPIIFILGVIFPVKCLGIDLGEIGKTLENAGVASILESANIDLNRISDYLNWETINISLIADYTNVTDIAGRKLAIDGKLYKSSINTLRVDLKSGIELPGKNPVRLTDCYVLYRLLKKQAYIVFPNREAFIEVDPDKARELIGALGKKRGGKLKIEKKQVLGVETVEGFECKKVSALIKSRGGMESNVTMLLAQNLKGFPIKIVDNFSAPRGASGTNTTVFNNIKKIEPDEELLTIPKNFTKYKNLVEVATEGKLGSRLKKRF